MHENCGFVKTAHTADIRDIMALTCINTGSLIRYVVVPWYP